MGSARLDVYAEQAGIGLDLRDRRPRTTALKAVVGLARPTAGRAFVRP
ncbi:hypothetical protein ACIOKD_26345 [Streptomyces sp. NPDC087844]